MLLSTRLRRHFLARLGLLLGGIGVALVVDTYWSIPAGLALALAGELVGRWLFFVSVVPRKVGAAFTGTRKEAA